MVTVESKKYNLYIFCIYINFSAQNTNLNSDVRFHVNLLSSTKIIFEYHKNFSGVSEKHFWDNKKIFLTNVKPLMCDSILSINVNDLSFQYFCGVIDNHNSQNNV